MGFYFYGLNKFRIVCEKLLRFIESAVRPGTRRVYQYWFLFASLLSWKPVTFLHGSYFGRGLVSYWPLNRWILDPCHRGRDGSFIIQTAALVSPKPLSVHFNHSELMMFHGKRAVTAQQICNSSQAQTFGLMATHVGSTKRSQCRFWCRSNTFLLWFYADLGLKAKLNVSITSCACIGELSRHFK